MDCKDDTAQSLGSFHSFISYFLIEFYPPGCPSFSKQNKKNWELNERVVKMSKSGGKVFYVRPINTKHHLPMSKHKDMHSLNFICHHASISKNNFKWSNVISFKCVLTQCKASTFASCCEVIILNGQMFIKQTQPAPPRPVWRIKKLLKYLHYTLPFQGK